MSCVVARSARAVTAVVAGRSGRSGMAVPRPTARPADHLTPAQLRACVAAAASVRGSASASPCIRCGTASATHLLEQKGRYPRHPDAARPQEARHNGDLHARCPQDDPRLSRSPLAARAPALLKTGAVMARLASRSQTPFRRHGEAYLAAPTRPSEPLGINLVVSGDPGLSHRALRWPCRACDGCGHVEIGYNSCRNRHCPGCQDLPRAPGSTSVKPIYRRSPTITSFTSAGGDRRNRFQNKAALYDLLGEDRCRDADDDRRRSEAASASESIHQRVAHWGSALPHHHPARPTSSSPAAACRRTANAGRLQARLLLPCVSCRASSVAASWKVCSPLHEGGRLTSSATSPARQPRCVQSRLAPLRRAEWVIYAKRPSGGPSGRPRLSVALHPPRRHLQTAASSH